MGWKFQILDYFPRAVSGPFFLPVTRRPGQDDPKTTPAIRCRLTRGRAFQEFWLEKTDADLISVRVGLELFQVGYNTSVFPLDFGLRLLRAQQTTDKGSSLPASQTSYVLLQDPNRGIDGQARVITLNQPLVHGGYRFYQSSYLFLGIDANGRPVSRSVLTVRRDPGLLAKYAGSAMLALGIACMFYMKAYFFKFLFRSSLGSLKDQLLEAGGSANHR
jgi:hypothetical protein